MSRSGFLQAVFFSILLLVLFSCASNSGQTFLPSEDIENVEAPQEEAIEEELQWEKASFLDELEGLWLYCQEDDSSQEYIFEYPFISKEKKYMRYALPESDDTDLWLKNAKLRGLSLEELWSKRFSFLNIIYKDGFPFADSNGTQTGLKIRMIGNRIYSRKEYLIPESILILNMKFFILSPDKKSFREEGFFRFASNKIEDLAGKQRIFTKDFGVSTGSEADFDFLDSAVIF